MKKLGNFAPILILEDSELREKILNQIYLLFAADDDESLLRVTLFLVSRTNLTVCEAKIMLMKNEKTTGSPI